ncbi:MAG: hypothetical protein E6583_00775 [Clostridium sp.]|nr:hypothetical protein [Clostridium sp.]
MFYILNTENQDFKRFRKGDKLLNNILVNIKSNKKIYFIFSTSQCNTLKICPLTFDNNSTTPINITKLENVLSSFTWSLTNSNLKTSDNGISYTLDSILRKNGIKIKAIFIKAKNKNTDKKIINYYLKIFNILLNNEKNKSA